MTAPTIPPHHIAECCRDDCPVEVERPRSPLEEILGCDITSRSEYCTICERLISDDFRERLKGRTE